jgi:hypothetical protein
MFARSMYIPTRREIASANAQQSWSVMSLLVRWLSGSKTA